MRSFLKNQFPRLWNVLRFSRRKVLNFRSAKSVFTEIYRDNAWGDGESVSGPGSNLRNTERIRRLLPEYLAEIEARSILDLPCGDLHWIREVDLGTVDYFGADIVPEIIARNRAEFAGENRQFQVLNLAHDRLPQVDAILVRDLFIHLPNNMIAQALANIAQSNIRYLIATTYSEVSENIDIEIGGFRHVNLQAQPFNLPTPRRIERENEGMGKSLGLWDLDAIHGRTIN